jgi:N-acetylglucosamine malate deacetylase 2
LAEERVLLIAAHPDDEVIGAGIQMTRWSRRQLTIVHVTDGSPRNTPNGAEYAATRRTELEQALKVAGLAGVECRELGFVDQEVYLHLPELIETIAELVNEIQPDVIYTHPYEGGHPDHDAAAFACALRKGRSGTCPTKEFTSYHGGPQGFITGEFLGDGNIKTYTLTDSECALKRRIFECYRSQERVLQHFEIGRERFRDAPVYDFTKPPHAGQLHYETLGWNITGERWRARASEALKTLSMRDVVC